MLENQLSRYGAMSKGVPFTIGKTWFLVSASEADYGDFSKTFPADRDGQVRVFTSWASVISALQLVTENACVVVSPLFTTAPTLAEIASINAAGAVVIQAGQNLPDGSYLATKAAANLASQTNLSVFQVNGRIEILELIGEMVTTSGATLTSRFVIEPTVGSNAGLCAPGDTSGLAVGAQMLITGTLANAIVTTINGAVAAQAAPVLCKAGNIKFYQSQTTTGFVKFLIRYKALDPGAFVSAL